MNCPRHPNKRAVASCKDCGGQFCIECVRETDQTTLCPDCYRRKMGDIAREFAAPAPPRAGRGPAPDPTTAPAEDFLSQGPDDDFSSLATRPPRSGRRRGRRASRITAARRDPGGEAAGAKEPAEREEAPQAGAEPPPRAKRALSAASGGPASEDELLQDVMSTLLKPQGAAHGAAAGETGASAAGEDAAGVLLRARKRAKRARVEAREKRKAKKALAAMDADGGSGPSQRWSFLAQPRSVEYTLIADSWWRAAAFVALMFLLGMALWALPNAYLIPKDQEYGIHAVLIGILLGLAFWWKASRKHSTKLAVQAALTTFFALFIGEFLHWFLVVVRFRALRTIFFDLVSFRFLWENGGEVLKYTVEAMFPAAFLWLLFLPALAAFIVGFGMPPIPEIFFQAWHALRGRGAGEKGARHGLET